LSFDIRLWRPILYQEWYFSIFGTLKEERSIEGSFAFILELSKKTHTNDHIKINLTQNCEK